MYIEIIIIIIIYLSLYILLSIYLYISIHLITVNLYLVGALVSVEIPIFFFLNSEISIFQLRDIYFTFFNFLMRSTQIHDQKTLR